MIEAYIAITVGSVGWLLWTLHVQRRLHRERLEAFAAKKRWTFSADASNKVFEVNGRSGRHDVSLVSSRLLSGKIRNTVRVPAEVPQDINVRRETWLTQRVDTRFGLEPFDEQVHATGNERILLARLCKRGRAMVEGHLTRALSDTLNGEGAIVGGDVTFEWRSGHLPPLSDMELVVDTSLELAEHLHPETEDDDSRLLWNVAEGPTALNRRLCFNWIVGKRTKADAARVLLDDTSLENQILGSISLEDVQALGTRFERALIEDESQLPAIAHGLATINTPAARGVLTRKIGSGGAVSSACLEAMNPGAISLSLPLIERLMADSQMSPKALAHLTAYLVPHGPAAIPLIKDILSSLDDMVAATAVEALGAIGTSVHIGVIQWRLTLWFSDYVAPPPTRLVSASQRAVAQIQSRVVGEAGGLALADPSEDEASGRLGLVNPDAAEDE